MPSPLHRETLRDPQGSAEGFARHPDRSDPADVPDVRALDEPRLQRVESFVDRYPGERLTLATVARIACMSRTSFSRYFHQKTGVRFRDWLTAKRVRRAVEQMMGTDHTITRIAFDVGFQSLSAFERAFRRIEGETPSEYRRRISRSRGNTPLSRQPDEKRATNAEPIDHYPP